MTSTQMISRMRMPAWSESWQKAHRDIAHFKMLCNWFVTHWSHGDGPKHTELLAGERRGALIRDAEECREPTPEPWPDAMVEVSVRSPSLLAAKRWLNKHGGPPLNELIQRYLLNDTTTACRLDVLARGSRAHWNRSSMQ